MVEMSQGAVADDALCEWMAVQGVALSCVAFVLLYACSAGIALAAPKWFGQLSSENQTLCRTGLTSYVHSLLSGAWTTYIVVTTPALLANTTSYRDWHSLATTAMSCGYFIADLAMMLWKGTFRETPLYLVHVHHVIVIICLWLCLLVNPDVSAYMVLALVCEVNNWFLHGGKLLRKIGFAADSALFRWNDVLFYITFFVFRMGPHVFTFYSIAGLRHEVPAVWQWLLGVVSSMALIAINVSMLVDFMRSRRRLATFVAVEKRYSQVEVPNGSAIGAANGTTNGKKVQ